MDEKKIELSYAFIYLYNLAIVFVVADTKLLLLNISYLIKINIKIHQLFMFNFLKTIFNK